MQLNLDLLAWENIEMKIMGVANERGGPKGRTHRHTIDLPPELTIKRNQDILIRQVKEVLSM